MKIVVAAFYADIVGAASRLDEFLPFILASRRALSITNPEAQYIVLTDSNTCNLLDNYDISCSVVAPEHMMLMPKIIFAQREFVRRCDADLIVLPDVDCLANRNLEDAIPDNVGLAITHRGAKFDYKINNIAYIHDRDLAVWFLDKAYEILEGWPRDRREWYGDQEAWQAVLADRDVIEPENNIPYTFDFIDGEHLLARPNGRPVHLYHCTTHNCIMSNDGNTRPVQREAFMIHFKGDRKRHLDKWMTERFGT